MRRIRELDALRGLSALAIVVYHFYAHWLPIGWVAVDLFFVLSGYLITSMILAHGDHPRFLPHFYVRRGLRIWPIYYLSLLGLLLLGPILPRPTEWAGLPYYASYTQNVHRYWSSAVPEFSWYFKHTWSLAVEEQFYLVWPLLVLVAGRKRLPALCLAFVSASVAARACGIHWWTLLGRGDGLALGGLLAAFPPEQTAEGWRGWPRGVLLSVGSIALGFVIVVGLRNGLPDHGEPLWPAPTVLALNLVCFAVLGLVIGLSGRPCLRPLRGPCLGYLGKISYGLYLYHMILLRIKMDLCDQLGWGRRLWIEALTLGLSVALAAVSWHLLERPILRLKDRFDYGPGAPSSSLSPAAPGETRVHAGHRLPGSREPHAPGRKVTDEAGRT